MKKRILIISLAVFATLVILLVTAVAVMINRGYGASVGRYLESKDGRPILVCDNSPTVMSNLAKRDIFDGLSVGDKIFVIHTAVAESYPGQTGAYAVFKLSGGSPDDISDKVVKELKSLGWLSVSPDDESGFYGGRLHLMLDGDMIVYDEAQDGTDGLTADHLIASFYTETSVEGIIWEVYSVIEHPDLSRVIVISGTNSSLTFSRVK